MSSSHMPDIAASLRCHMLLGATGSAAAELPRCYIRYADIIAMLMLRFSLSLITYCFFRALRLCFDIFMPLFSY